jgi:glycosyltransferase involved in cell wall biosynthesis
MRVLVLSSDSHTFDTESAVARRFRLQAQAVERLDVIVPHGPGNLVQLAGNSAARGFGLGKVTGFFRTLAAGARIMRPDIVSTQDPFFLGLLGWIIARMRGAKLHVQVHTDLFDPHFVGHSLGNRLRTYVGRFVLGRADLVRVVSERIKGTLQKRGMRAPIAVLPVYIDPLRGQKTAPINKNQKYPQFTKIVLAVSRLESEKGIDTTLRVFAEMVREEPSIGLVILGRGSHKSRLENLARELGIAGQVVFEDYQDPFPYFKAADLLLVTSEYEGYGMVIVEALLANCPVVSLDVGIAKESGAIVASRAAIAAEALRVLRAGARGNLAFMLPTESEYRDLWRAQMDSVGREYRPAAATHGDLPVVGFVGQGWIGKNYADDMERRGIRVVRYALEEPYRANKDNIKDCDVVFIAVPTPTKPTGFDDSNVQSALELVGEGKSAVIKSTVVPGTTEKFQKMFPNKFVMMSPEFLAEATAVYDATHPTRNIVGIPEATAEFETRARQVLRVLPPAPFELICSSTEAELIKYAGNTVLALKVVYANMLYDMVECMGGRYDMVRDAIGADPRIGRSHIEHRSGHHGAKVGRGAGGDCFIKDFEAFRRLYDERVSDQKGSALLDAIITKNLHLLLSSDKDRELLKSVYGDDIDRRILG